MFYLMKGNTEKARASLEFFRGPNNGTVSRELDDMQKSLAKVCAILCYAFKTA